MTTNKQAFYFILITLFLDAVGIGIIIPIMPELIMELTGKDVSGASTYSGWLFFVYALVQFFCAPILGNLSDRYGRRPVLLFSLVAFSLDYLLMALAPTFAWLLIGRFLAGIAGATHGAATAYIADITPPEKRAQNFGMMGAVFGLGFIVGPVIGGILGMYGSRVPFVCSAIICFLAAIYGFFVLPETLTKDKRRVFTWQRANPVGAFLQMKKFPIVVTLLIVFFISRLANDVYPSIWTYYTLENFKWTRNEIAYSLAFVGIMMGLVQGSFIRVAIRKMGEYKTLYVGLFMSTFSFIGFAFTKQGWIAYIFMSTSAFGGFIEPALRSLMSNEVDANQQGELQGAISSLVSLSAIISPLMMTQIFSYFTKEGNSVYFPGAPFLWAAILILCSMLFFTIMCETWKK